MLQTIGAIILVIAAVAWASLRAYRFFSSRGITSCGQDRCAGCPAQGCADRRRE